MDSFRYIVRLFPPKSDRLLGVSKGLYSVLRACGSVGFSCTKRSVIMSLQRVRGVLLVAGDQECGSITINVNTRQRLAALLMV